jgi:TRAP-type C4-dicarboxylate transport system permease small subunit
MFKPLDRLVTFTGVLVGVAALFIGLSVSYDVIARALLGATTNWVTDVNTYLVAFITFIGAGFAQRDGAHVGVDIVTTRLKPGLRHLAFRLSNLLVLAIIALITYLSSQMWLDSWRSGEQSAGLFALPLWIPYGALPAGMLLLLIVQLRITFGPFPERSRPE